MTTEPTRPVSTRVMNLSRFVTQAARREPDAIALVRGDTVVTWAEFDRRVDALAAALQARGVGKGDRVLCQSQNCLAMMDAMFAVLRAGAVWVPTNFRQTPAEVRELAQTAHASAMICNAAFPEHAAACRDVVPRVLSLGPADFGEDAEALAAGTGVPEVPPADRDDPAWFFFTSGTTGRPKASVLTHGQLAFVVTNHLADLMPGLTSADASLVVAPLSHGAGVHQLTQIARGVKTVLLPGDRFDVAAAWALVARWRVSTMFTVPTILKMLVEHPAAASADVSSLRYVIYAGAPMYREDQKRALALLGPAIVQYFGLGEVTGNITVLPGPLHATEDGWPKLGTCGFARTGIEIEIQDEAGRALGPGETGEICCIGPAVFAGYYDNPEANAAAFRNGWFRTGDLGHLDAEGFLYITGRASDMYISGGSNVYPREVEEKILAFPGISECAVVGVPDRTWGEVGVAVCVAEPGASVSAEALAAHLAAQIARYKLPKAFLFWDGLPKSGYGKVLKRVIREEIARAAEAGR